ncbi:MAG: sensor histidine kinase [Deltaproteobacteria bacterium]|nr:sensor histidine kinase [Deltaproteobacteria bacterium]
MDTIKKTAQIGLIVLLVLIVTILHYSSDHGALGAHISHREFYFIPILLSSLWFGLKHGLATSFAISLIYAPQVLVHSETPSNLWPVVFQIMVFNLVAIMVGFLVERSKRQQERMFVAEKSAALGRAATAVGHEMKDLLNALKSIASKTARPEGGALNQEFEKELLRLEQLVDIFSSFKTTGPLQLFSHDLNDIIRERVKHHRAVAGKNGVSFTTDLDAEGCPSRVDIETIRRVIDRIIQNALEVSVPGKAIHIHSTRKGDRCEVTIADEGPGIKPEHLPQIFKPFFTTKENGDGLALSSSQKLLRDMGGDIQVASEYGKGAIFTISVPREYSEGLLR